MNLSPSVKWTKEHIDYVLQARAREGKFLDYKQTLPSSKDDDIELLADVSAFANTSGGIILYGISEEKGEPVACPGVAPGDLDKAILRLEAVIRSNLDPTLVNFHPDIIETADKSAVVALRIPASANAPHMIAKGSPKFYARGAAGKIPMDAYEIKSAFLSADSLAYKITRFRNERCALISINDLPFPLSSISVAVLHIVPVSAFQRPTQFSTEQLEKVTQDIRPPGNISGWGPQVCLEGVARTTSEDDRKTYSYCLTFRSSS
jgi:Putative DNA-binding domain